MNKVVLRTTLVLLFREKQILLGYKKRGFGKWKWNGFGGKIEENETPSQAACREVAEECRVNVKAHDLQRIGLLQFEFVGKNLFIEVNVYKADLFEGEAAETEEMRPKWFDIADIPFDNMWADDIFWYPLMLSDKIFLGQSTFTGDDFDEMLNHDIKEISSLKELDEKKYPETI